MSERAVEPNAKPWGRVYAALRSARGVAEGAAPAHEADVAEFCRRLGAFPRSWSGPRAEAAVAWVVESMAREAGESPAQVRADLALFSSGTCSAVPLCGECPVREHCGYPDRRLTIKDLPETERPRERLLQEGAEHLSDAELLALIIGGGSARATALDLARRLLTTFGRFRKLAECSTGELTRVHGIGAAKAARIQAALAIARRYAAERLPAGATITGSEQVVHHMQEQLAGLHKECFVMLMLDTKNRLIRQEQIAVGSLSESVVHPREVFKPAIAESAAKVVFVHNHPSGSPEPSAQDRRLTARLREVGELVGIPVLDHVIVGAQGYFSFAEQGLL